MCSLSSQVNSVDTVSYPECLSLTWYLDEIVWKKYVLKKAGIRHEGVIRHKYRAFSSNLKFVPKLTWSFYEHLTSLNSFFIHQDEPGNVSDTQPSFFFLYSPNKTLWFSSHCQKHYNEHFMKLPPPPSLYHPIRLNRVPKLNCSVASVQLHLTGHNIEKFASANTTLPVHECLYQELLEIKK